MFLLTQSEFQYCHFPISAELLRECLSQATLHLLDLLEYPLVSTLKRSQELLLILNSIRQVTPTQTSMPNRGKGKGAIARHVVARPRLDQFVVVRRDCGPHPNERNLSALGLA